MTMTMTMTSKPLFSLLALLTVFYFQGTFAFEEPENITLSTHGVILSKEKSLLRTDGFELMLSDTLAHLIPRHGGWLKLGLSLDEIHGDNIVFPDGSIFPIDASIENDLIFWLEDENDQEGSGHFVRLFPSPDSDALAHSIVSIIDGRKIHLGAKEQEQEKTNKESLQLNNLKLSALIITTSDESRSRVSREDDSSSLYSGYPGDDQDTPYSKKSPPPAYGNAWFPLFNRLDAIFEAVGSVGSPWLIRGGNGIGLAIKQIPQVPLSKQFYLDSIVNNLAHTEQMVQVNMLYVPITPQSPDAATPAHLEPLEIIMNWLANEVKNTDELYSIHRALLQTRGDFQGKETFLKKFIGRDGKLRAKRLLKNWKSRVGGSLPGELKKTLQRMRYRFSEKVSGAFAEMVSTQDMVQGTEVVKYQPEGKKIKTLSSQKIVHRLKKEYRPPLPGVTPIDSLNYYSTAQGGQQTIRGAGISMSGASSSIKAVQPVSDPSEAKPERLLGEDEKPEWYADEEEEDK